MPTFLPITALTRSQAVRIGGQTIKPIVTSYIDLGLVDPVGPLTFAKSEAAAASSLVKSKYYNYAVTAVDASGGETNVINAKVEKAGAGAEGAGEFNTLEPKWTAVGHASKYRIYRNPVAGGSSAAVAESESLTLIAEVASTLFAYNDLGVANKTATPPSVNNTHYNVNGSAFSTRKEIQNHTAIGAILVAGRQTLSNLDYVPYATAAGFELKLESEQYKVLKTKVVQRSTDRLLAETNELTAASFKTAGATKTILSIAVLNTATGQLEALTGVEETTEAPGPANFAKVAEKVRAYHQVLYVLQAKIKVVTNVTATFLTGTSTPRLGDTTNFPVIAAAS